MLKLTNVSGGSKNLTNMTLDFRRSGAARKLQADDSFTLLENMSGKITVGEGVTMKGTDGIAHDCLFAIVPDKAHTERLFEASARAGRAKSDYGLHGENAGYDGSNAYYGLHLGVGKTFTLSENASLDAYVRYFWSHQDGISVKLRGSGDVYDFADIDSHRLRLGFRYSKKDKNTGECYAGLAWEREFGGEASASVGTSKATTATTSSSMASSNCTVTVLCRAGRTAAKTKNRSTDPEGAVLLFFACFFEAACFQRGLRSGR